MRRAAWRLRDDLPTTASDAAAVDDDDDGDDADHAVSDKDHCILQSSAAISTILTLLEHRPIEMYEKPTYHSVPFIINN